MYLLIDNYDSFVHNLFMYFKELGQEVIIYRNDEIEIEDIRALDPKGIIISPGPKDPRDTGICLKVIEEFKGKIPILGICLGHQSIAYSFGGKIIKGKAPMHGKVSSIEHIGKGVFKGLKSPLKVTRYHSLIVEKSSIQRSFIITAISEDGVIMGIRHKEYFLEGLQFHPEAVLTEYGHSMIKNFIDESCDYCNNNQSEI